MWCTVDESVTEESRGVDGRNPSFKGSRNDGRASFMSSQSRSYPFVGSCLNHHQRSGSGESGYPRHYGCMVAQKIKYTLYHREAGKMWIFAVVELRGGDEACRSRRLSLED